MVRRHEEQLSADALLLDQYLNQYKRCIIRKKVLERRRRDIAQEFNHPLTGISYDGMPRGSGAETGCAALSYRLDEIDTWIKDQMAKSAKTLTEIMEVIEFLPENTIERSILEHRYIDRMGWKKICMEECISRTPATRHWRKGLYDLLEFKKVQMIVHEYEKSQRVI